MVKTFWTTAAQTASEANCLGCPLGLLCLLHFPLDLDHLDISGVF